ncbi:RNA-dependent RNA polymerase [Colletotrichum kahawae]|uniref:RNA-dependent RNA polymerase n=1 Tax=Colletotrichum kahawae TaxID=34407 RepID=A0AAE0D704_COLKA|nr:RNA-dependent RNA polymerase [Colletotrichum kahawae]
MAPQNNTIPEKVVTAIRELNNKYNLGIEIPDTTSTSSLVSSRAQCDAKFARSLAILKYAIHHYHRNVFLLDKILRSFLWEALAISEDWIHPCHPHDMIAATTTPPKAHSPGELLRLQLTLIDVLKRAAEITDNTSSALDNEIGFSQSVNPFQPASAGAIVSHPSTTTCVLTPESTRATTNGPPPDNAKYIPVDSPAKEIPIPDAQRTVPEQEHTPPPSWHSHSCDNSSGELGVGVRLSDHGHLPGHVFIPGDASPSVHKTQPTCDLGSKLLGVSLQQISCSVNASRRLPGFSVDHAAAGFPSWLTRAPFAVAWEVTRIALHCGVDPDSLVMSFDETWDDYDIMCRALREHPSFDKRVFPERPSPEAWAAGLRSFESLQEQHVTFAAFLVQTKNVRSGPIFSLVMKPAVLDKGCRLYRHFGPDRFLSLTIPSPSSWTAPINDPDKSEEVIRWLSSCSHHLAGRQWRAFYARDAGRKVPQVSVLLGPQPKAISQTTLTYFAEDGRNFAAACSPMEVWEMLDWLLQLDRNERQPYLKLFARIQLGLSKTTAVAVLNEDQIRHIQENVVSPIGRVMNDGVGRMSLSLARKVRDDLGLSDIPSAIQGRLGSAKGMWIIDVEDTGSDIWIETWPSQRKWDCDFLHKEHRTLEVKNPVAEPRSASLNIQFLPILENRAKDKQRMRKVVGDNLLRQISDEIEAQKNAIKHPLQFRQWVNENAHARRQRSAQGGVPFLAGLPDSEEEQLNYLVDGGFEPTKQKFMQDKIWGLRHKKCENLLKKMSIIIPNSAYLYMVVDFWGILEENEVHVCFSSTFRTESFSDSMLHGCDVLVARSPAHLVSDIQRVKAVFKPELRALKDVVVFSAKGDVALADKLSGGDYDGDRAWVCWEPAIVSNFENANVPTRPDLSGILRKDEASFGDLDREVSNLSAASAMITRGIAFEMQAKFLGIVTKFKERLCYSMNDVNNEQAVWLSTLLGSLVDQSKQGLQFTVGDWKLFQEKVLSGCQVHMVGEPAYEQKSWTSRGDPVHIIDFLKFGVAKPAIEEELRKLSQAMTLSSGSSREVTPLTPCEHADGDQTAEYWDVDLVGPYRDLEKLASTDLVAKRVLINLRKDLESVKTKWDSSVAPVTDESQRPGLMVEVFKEWCAIRPRADAELSPVLMIWLEPSYASEEHSTWALLRASTSFEYWHKKPKLVWRMAGIQLQFIKSMAQRGRAPVSVVPNVYAALKPDGKFIHQAVSRMTESMEPVVGCYGQVSDSRVC